MKIHSESPATSSTLAPRASCLRGAALLAAALLAVAVLPACQKQFEPGPNLRLAGPQAAAGKVPRPLDLLLPQSIRIHPFTSVKMLDEAKGVRGLEVRVEALDAYQDAAKAFGEFRFELYSYRAFSSDHRGTLLTTWEESLASPRRNIARWDHITRSYVFKLQLYRSVPQGQRLVLVAYFSSPYTERLYAERVLTAQ